MDIQLKLIRTYNLSARLIHIGMWLWATLRGKKHFKTYNHCQIYFDEYTSGALSGGVKKMKWSDYLNTLKKNEILSIKLDITEEEERRGLAYLKSVEGNKYEFSIFFWHAVKIFIGKWFGNKNTKKIACVEHAIRFLNATGKYNYNVYMNNYEFQEIVVEDLKNK